MTLRLVARPNGLLIPVSDLNLKDLPSRDLIVGDDIQLVLANLLGFDGNQPRLLKVDANGNLRITSVGALNAQKVELTNTAQNVFADPAAFTADVANTLGALPVFAAMYDGVTGAWRPRGASAANVAAQSGLGVALGVGPGEWTATSAPATGTAAAATRAAGGAGVRHVARSILVSWGSNPAPAAAAAFFVQLRDGASGVGTIIWQAVGAIQAVAGNFAAITLGGLNIVGSAATAMTLEFSTGLSNTNTAASLTGYDAS